MKMSKCKSISYRQLVYDYFKLKIPWWYILAPRKKEGEDYFEVEMLTLGVTKSFGFSGEEIYENYSCNDYDLLPNGIRFILNDR